MMLYQLPQPVAGQTHAEISYVEIRPDVSIEVAGRLGTAEKDVFVPLESFSGLGFRRKIEGPGLVAFTEATEKAGFGLAALMAVLAAHLDATGLEKSRFAEATTEAVDAAPAVEALP